jgi:hypothetical protein
VMATMGTMSLVPVVAVMTMIVLVAVGLRAGDHDAECQHRGKGDPDPTQSFSPPTSHSLANQLPGQPANSDRSMGFTDRAVS